MFCRMLSSDVTINATTSESDPAVTDTTKRRGERIPLLFRKNIFGRFFKLNSPPTEANNR